MSGWVGRFGGREWRQDGPYLFSRDQDTKIRSAPHRTAGEPVTMRRYLDAWGDEITDAARAAGIPLPLLLAPVATENGPARPGPEKGLGFMPPRYRGESGGRLSVGPCHVLISTARQVMGGDPAVDREWLSDLGNNMLAAARYIAAGKSRTGWEPILVPARYNAGAIYDSSSPRSIYHNRWHIRSTGNHLDRFADWFGDALAVLAGRDDEAPSVPRPDPGPIEIRPGMLPGPRELPDSLRAPARPITPEVLRQELAGAGFDPSDIDRLARVMERAHSVAEGAVGLHDRAGPLLRDLVAVWRAVRERR